MTLLGGTGVMLWYAANRKERMSCCRWDDGRTAQLSNVWDKGTVNRRVSNTLVTHYLQLRV